MNKLIIVILFIAITANVSCAGEKSKSLQAFLNGVISVDEDQISGSEPIIQLNTILADKAEKSIVITKENIKESLTEAKQYSKILIVVGKHTVIKIKDISDCKTSGSWGACMPKGVALTQKAGSFTEKIDYINNLMGLPDGQSRIMYLFK